MFDRVVMDVINMLAKVGFVANLMFPKSPLPDGLFALGLARDGLLLLIRLRTPEAEPGFDAFPPG